VRLKSKVGGLVFGRYIREGLGAGCEMYSGNSCEAERGRDVYVFERIG
jgi:hypothetical protein